MKTFSIYLSDDEVVYLEEKAKKEYRSINSIIKELIRHSKEGENRVN